MRGILAPLACFVLIVCTTAGIRPAAAQTDGQVVPSGRPAIVGSYFNCVRPGSIPSVSGTAYHGTVAVRHAYMSRCGNPRHLVVLMIYTSHPGYRGADEVVLQGPPRVSKKIIVR